VVIPAHRGERWIGETLRSIRDQTEPDGIEVILIDSSPDELTLQAAQPFLTQLPLRLLRRPDLCGWQAKTNLGAHLARGRYLCMLHQDDAWQPGRGAAAKRWLADAPDTMLHLNASVILDEAGRHLGIWRCPLRPDEDILHDQFIERLIVQCFVATPAPIMRRDAFLAVGGLDEDLWYTADWDLYLKLATQGTVRYHREALTCFRIHGQSLTVSGTRRLDDYERQLEVVLRRHLPKVKGDGASDISGQAKASVAVNVSLAAVLHGHRSRIWTGIAAILRLGPLGAASYVRNSRIFERLVPRLRARMAGTL
jgi:hypothetical protein